MNFFNHIIGHTKQIGALNHSMPGQSYLFSGPSGVGKKLIAIAFAQKILGISKPSHPDLLIYTTDENIIKVENIREIQNFVNLKSFSSGNRVVIIDEAQKMNPQAANSLLKTLEEPPQGCHFILVTSNKGMMLSTILSRCQKFQFGNLSLSELKKIHPDAPPWALELSQGRTDLLNQYVDPEKRELREVCLKIFKGFPDLRTYEGFEKLDPLTEDKDSAFFATTLWQHWIKQVELLVLGQKTHSQTEEAAVFLDLSKKIKKNGAFKISENLIQLEKDVQANVNRKLAFENFFLEAKNYF